MATPWPRRLAAIATAAVCGFVLASHVHLGFERVRLRVVTEPISATGSVVRVPLPDLTRLGGGPAAVIARIGTNDETGPVRLALDGTTLGAAALGQRQSTRLDFVARIPERGPHTLEVTGPRDGWRLEYLEIANVHGFSDGPLAFVLVPAEAPPPPFVPWWVALLVTLELLALGLAARSPDTRTGRALRLLATAPVLALFLVTLAAHIVTTYRILLAPQTFGLGVVLLYAAPLLAGLRNAAARLPPARTLAARLPHAALVLIVLTGVARFYEPETGFTRLIMFGSHFASSAVPRLRAVPVAIDSEFGYDGQFYAQLALDPLLLDEATPAALDSPAYRARRVLVPALAFVLGLGQTWPVLQAYALMNVLSWLALGWLLLRWLPPGPWRTTLAWVAIMASHGLLASMRLSLADGPALLVVALAVAALDTRRPWLSAALVGIGGLAKETSLLAGAILLPATRPSPRQIRAVALQGALALAPFGAWLTYTALLNLPGESAGLRNFDVPFTAYAAKWSTSLDALRFDDFHSWSSVLTLVALTTQVVYVASVRAWNDPWWRVGAGYAVLTLVVGPAVWEGQPGAITRAVLPLTVAFNVLVSRHRGFAPLWALGNANLLHGPAEVAWWWWW